MIWSLFRSKTHQEATDGNPNNSWHLHKPKPTQNMRLLPRKVWAPHSEGGRSGGSPAPCFRDG